MCKLIQLISIICLFGLVHCIRFRFWDMNYTPSETVDNSIICSIFGLSNMQSIDAALQCDNTSPCSSVPGVKCSQTSNSTDIIGIDFSNQVLQGFLPSTINELGSLTSLDLSLNYFSGTIPTIFGMLDNLQSLSLLSNSLTGAIPSELCKLKKLTYLSLDRNILDCYDSCFISMVNLEADFLAAPSLQVCSTLVEDAYLSKYTREAYSTCSYAQNSLPSLEWSNRDFCSYYGSLSSHSIPSCLLSYGSVYCQTFSLFTLGCGADYGNTTTDVANLADKCLVNFYKLQPSLTLISISFTFNLLNVQLDILSADVSSPATYNNDKTTLTNALSTASGFASFAIVISSITPSTTTGQGSASVSGVLHSSAEELGYNDDSSMLAAQLMQKLINDALTRSGESDSQFVIELKLSTNTPSGTYLTNEVAFLQSSYILSTTSTDMPVFATPIIQFVKTALPTVEPTVLSKPGSTFRPTQLPVVSLNPTPVPASTASPTSSQNPTQSSSSPYRVPVPSPNMISVPSSPTLAPTNLMSCLNLELVDLFGDGWGKAKLVVYTSYGGRTSKLAPMCSTNPMYTQHCFSMANNDDGDYVVMMVAGFAPERPWEIFWRVTDSLSGASYTGNYDTTLIFTFRERFQATDSGVYQFRAWMEVTNSIGVVQPDGSCKSCVVATATQKSSVGDDSSNSEVKASVDSSSGSLSEGKDLKSNSPKGLIGGGGGKNLGDGGRASRVGGSSIGKDKSLPDQGTVSKPGKSAASSPALSVKPFTNAGGATTSTSTVVAPKLSSSSGQDSTLDKNDNVVRKRPSGDGGPVDKAHGGDDKKRGHDGPPLVRDAETTNTYGKYTHIISYQTPEDTPYLLEKDADIYIRDVDNADIRNTDVNVKNAELSSTSSMRHLMTDHIPSDFQNVHKYTMNRHLDDSYDLSYKLTGYQNSWSSDNGLGAMFYVSDANGGLLVSGTLCASDTTTCDVGFQDGTYHWRVTGEFSSNAAAVGWSFCGSKGKAGAELIFEVQQGRCIPKVLSYASSSCGVTDDDNDADDDKGEARLTESVANIGVTVHGVLELQGVDVDTLSDDAVGVIKSALSDEVADSGVGSDGILVTDVTTPSVFLHRRLQAIGGVVVETVDGNVEDSYSEVTRVSFRIKLSSSSISVSQLKEYFDKAMRSGLFVTRLKWLSRGVGDVSLSHVHHASLLDLKILHETIENKMFSSLASVIVGVSGGVGFVFGIMFIVSHRRRKISREYKSVQLVDTDFSLNS